MILSSIKSNYTKQKGIDQTQQILICCDNFECQKQYEISILAQKSCFKKYQKDLCRGCQQKEQIKLGIRGKQYINAGKSIQKKFTGKNYIEIYGKEKALNIKKSMSLKASGKNNSMYGRNDQCSGLINYGKSHKGKTNIEIFGKEKAKNIQNKLSQASSGKNNPMYGKPAPKGSGNGWSGWYKGTYFRSLKELSFIINVLERFNFKWETGENKNYQIKYFDYWENEKTYFADFIIEDKYLVEIKPKKLWNSDLVKRKKESAIQFCQEKGLKYKLIDPNKTLSNNDIKILIEENKLQFIKRYQEKFKLWES